MFFQYYRNIFRLISPLSFAKVRSFEGDICSFVAIKWFSRWNSRPHTTVGIQSSFCTSFTYVLIKCGKNSPAWRLIFFSCLTCRGVTRNTWWSWAAISSLPFHLKPHIPTLRTESTKKVSFHEFASVPDSESLPPNSSLHLLLSLLSLLSVFLFSSE